MITVGCTNFLLERICFRASKPLFLGILISRKMNCGETFSRILINLSALETVTTVNLGNVESKADNRNKESSQSSSAMTTRFGSTCIFVFFKRKGRVNTALGLIGSVSTQVGKIRRRIDPCSAM